MERLMAKLKRHSPKFWKQVLSELEASGLSARAFAEHRGVNYWTMLGWRRRFRERERRFAAEVRLLPVTVKAAEDSTVTGTVGCTDMELQLVEGIGLRFAVGTDVDYVGRLVRSLRFSTPW